MKTLLLLLSLSAVGFGQQAKPAEKCVEGPMRKEASCPKPPKPKPSVKPSSVHVGWDDGLIVAPDKAAVPVEPKDDQLYTFTTISSPSFTIMSQNADCSWQGFQYDAKTKTCSMKIVFDVSSQVVCTPLVLNEQGKPEMTCSFKLIDKGGK